MGAPANASTPPAVVAPTTAAEARARFAEAVVGNDAVGAFSLLAPVDRERFVNPQRFAVELGSQAPWIAATPSGGDAVLVTRAASLDPVLGLVTPTATVTLPVTEEGGRPTVMWSRRVIEERAAADETTLPSTVARWANARQACNASASADETDNGLVGVVGLATAICDAKGAVTVGGSDEVMYLLDLDDPAPVLDAYGSDAATWARVVPFTAPVAMNVVLAPVGDDWKVIATTHPTLDQQQRSRTP